MSIICHITSVCRIILLLLCPDVPLLMFLPVLPRQTKASHIIQTEPVHTLKCGTELLVHAKYTESILYVDQGMLLCAGLHPSKAKLELQKHLAGLENQEQAAVFETTMVGSVILTLKPQ